RDLGDIAVCAGASVDRAQGGPFSVSAGAPGHRFSRAGVFAAAAALASDIRTAVALAQKCSGESRHRRFRRSDDLFRALSLWCAAAHADGEISLSPWAGHGVQPGCAVPVLSAVPGGRFLIQEVECRATFIAPGSRTRLSDQ